MGKNETLERAFVLAGLDAVREVGGEALVQILLASGVPVEWGQAPSGLPDTVTAVLTLGLASNTHRG